MKYSWKIQRSKWAKQVGWEGQLTSLVLTRKQTGCLVFAHDAVTYFWLVSFHFKSTCTNIASDPTQECVPPGEPVWDVAFSLEKNSWISRGVEIVKLLPKRKTPRVAADAMRRNQRDPRRRLLSPLARRTHTPLRIFEILQSPQIRKSMAKNCLNDKRWHWWPIKGGYGPFDYRSYDTALILHLWLMIRFVTLPEQRKPQQAQMFGKKGGK